MSLEAGVATTSRLLLGRDRELAELYMLIDAIEERGRAIVVSGEAGIGKSALLAAARDGRSTAGSRSCPRWARSPSRVSLLRGFINCCFPCSGTS